MNTDNILKSVLMLVGGGYLKLEKVSAIHEHPYVSIIIPVRDRPDDLRDCVKSLENLNYPREKFEIIVVDDGSKEVLSKILPLPGVKYLRHEISRGQSAARNTGAGAARGDILAFLDADCVAGTNWLAETVPFFRASGIAAVGGKIDGYHDKSFLDRYEKTFSSLNMGRRFIMAEKSGSNFYVPTANLLVGREAYRSAGGFNEKMRIGEDVDFCWRLRDKGCGLAYAPFGAVAHKHRNRLGPMLKRRFEYGSSEAMLYGRHRDKKKFFNISHWSGLSFLALLAAILLLNPFPLCALPAFFLAELLVKYATSRKIHLPDSFWTITASALRSHLSFFYYAFFHLVRYYLVLFIGFGFLWYPLWITGGLGLVLASVIDFITKKPSLFYPVFLWFYLLEQLFYQAGVFWGCLKYRYFGSYLLSLKKGLPGG